MGLKQENRMLNLATPLGDDELLLNAFSGDEELSRLFRYELEMISDDNAIAAADIVGKNVTFNVELADNSRRFFNGHISQFVAGDEKDGRRNYRAVVVPWLWFLTQTADCRIFQEKKIKDIIEQIFGDLGFSDFEFKLKLDHKTWEYCVQYRETDFEFVSRLMEQEGMFYFFRHENGKHTLVVADHVGAYEDCVENEVDFPFDVSSKAITDHITGWEHRYAFCSGKVAHTDYNFKTPSTSLMAKTKSVVQLPEIDRYEVYDYPGEYPDKGVGDGEAKIRMEEIEAAHDVVHASSYCKTFTPGSKFTIGEHINESEKGKSFVITSIHHAAVEPMGYETGGAAAAEDYSNQFSCIPDSVVFAAASSTTKPMINGMQTAIVVGPSGEEIYPDEFGRVKCQFHWDREGQFDEKSSCWIRVSQVHAGKSFGGIDLPRIGEEVIVAFLEADPDQPIIVGRVYHAENMPPFGLPAAMNVSGMKTNSTKGGGGYNEMSMDDTKGKEKITIHAQYDMGTTVEHDDTQTVHNNRTITVDGTHTETITKDTTIKITEGAFSHDVVANKATYHVSGDVKEDFDATQKTTVNSAVEIKSKTSHIHLTASSDIKLEVGSSKLVMNKDGTIELSGTAIAIKGKASVSTDGGKISTTAKGNHITEGGIVMSTAKGSNIVKGTMVMLNPGG